MRLPSVSGSLTGPRELVNWHFSPARGRMCTGGRHPGGGIESTVSNKRSFSQESEFMKFRTISTFPCLQITAFRWIIITTEVSYPAVSHFVLDLVRNSNFHPRFPSCHRLWITTCSGLSETGGKIALAWVINIIESQCKQNTMSSATKLFHECLFLIVSV